MNGSPLALRFAGYSLLSLCTTLVACSSDEGPEGGSGGGTTGGTSSGAGGDSASGGSMSAGGTSSGSGGATGSGGGSSSGEQFPADTSVAGIEAFLATGSYKNWTKEAAPRAVLGSFEAHSPLMQVYFNDIAASTPEAVTLNGMVVKELYDEGGTQIGIAASLKTSEAADRWTFYCTTDTGEGCQSNETEFPIYEVHEFIEGCAGCHGDALLTPVP